MGERGSPAVVANVMQHKSYGNDSLQTGLFERVVKSGPGSFGCHALTPRVAGEPPSDFWIRSIAPESDAAEADEFPIRLSQQLPAAEFAPVMYRITSESVAMGRNSVQSELCH